MASIGETVKRGVATAATAGALIYLSGCSVAAEENGPPKPTPEEEQLEILEEAGFVGKVPMKQVDLSSYTATSETSSMEFDGSAWGFALIGGGSVEGSSSSSSQTVIQDRVRIAWQTNSGIGAITISDFPLEKVQVVEVNEGVEPTAEFHWLAEELLREDCTLPNGEPDTCRKGPWLSINPNTMIEHYGGRAIPSVTLHLPPEASNAFFAQVASLQTEALG